MVTRRAALVLFLSHVVTLSFAIFLHQPWDIAATGASVLSGTAALLMYFAVRARERDEGR
jgi:uncharacterized membrane protein YkgB